METLRDRVTYPGWIISRDGETGGWVADRKTALTPEQRRHGCRPHIEATTYHQLVRQIIAQDIKAAWYAPTTRHPGC